MHKHDAPVMGVLALCAFFMFGVGHLIVIDMENSALLKEQCIAAGKQIIEGNCINE